MALIIPFDVKFTENQLDNCINDFWRDSLKGETIKFDLSILEWITIEEITYLFAWIRNLKQRGKKVSILLPYPYDILQFLNITEEVNELRKKRYEKDEVKRIDRRKRLNLFLLSIWKMLTRLGLKSDDFINVIEEYNKLDDKLKSSIFIHKVIPFTVLDSSYQSNLKIQVENEFESALKGQKTKIHDQESGEKLFNLSEKLISLLTHYGCFSPFESKIISHVVTKELFINSIEHSGIDECYFSVALKNKWENISNKNYINSFIEEKSIDTLDFYKDKSQILKEIKTKHNDLSKFNRINEPDIREADLSRFNSQFKNQSYVEFSFIDFGNGIYNTLSNEFERDKNQVNNYFSNNFSEKHKHSQILEYAFLIESSRNPYDRNIEYSELIPRGLYFLVDMVRRFKGMLIARSGYGKVVYDFSDKIYVVKKEDKLEVIKERIYQAKDAVRVNSANPSFFDGTMVSLILPERIIERLKMSPVRVDDRILNQYIFNLSDSDTFPKEFFKPEKIEYLSLVFLHQGALNELNFEQLNSKTALDNFIFKKIDNKLNELRGISSLLFIDFEFLYERSNYLKIISWLTNTPKVNELTKVIIINLTKDESTVIDKFKENLSNKQIFFETEFLYKPIPCINLKKPIDSEITKKDIQWVGLRSVNDEALLTNLLFGSKESYPVSYFEKKWLTEGHIVSKFQDNTYSNFGDFSSIIYVYKRAKQIFLENWIIKNEIKDGENPKFGKEKFIYLTSRGSYQKKYISLYETLHNKYIAKLFAKYLLDKYIVNELNKGISKENISFNKIIVVTVCSQLIGVGIRDLIRDHEEYSFLKITSKHNNLNKSAPKLIRLASYYSFDTEKPFEEINILDNIILVNDVISTGSLIQRLIDGIERKKATIKSIMTIVDNRFLYKSSESQNDIGSIQFSASYEDILISTLNSKENENSALDMNKSSIKPTGFKLIKRINPILNSVVELSYNHSENSRVLYENPEEFFSSDFCDRNIFKIGHFKQGLSHNGYYTDMFELFQSENGFKIIANLKGRIENHLELHRLTSRENSIISLRNAANDIEKVYNSDNKDFNEIKSDIANVMASLNNLLNRFEKSNDSSEYTYNYCPDFIFHPVFSGIEEVSDVTFHDIFGTEVDNIIGLQRYNTKNGWRFPFPAKRYNKLTKGKHILIIDSGSLTGDSLVQLVDSISFLEVGRIDFLSIIGRIDDFQREFYSRLKSIKVKCLIQGEEERRYINSIVNLNLLFGINLHIPPYGSRVVCPYCKEIEKIKSYHNRYKNKNIPVQTKEYIKNRLENEIRLVDDRDDIFIPSYLPKLADGIPDLVNIFVMRDKIGKVDSYRFYQEYFEPFDFIADIANCNIFQNKDNLRNLETILVCILHEPDLYGLIRDLLINIHKILDKIINEIIFDNTKSLNDFNYIWSRYAFIRLAVIFKRDEIYEENTFEKMVYFSIDDENGLNYLSYLLSEGLLEQSENSKINKKIRKILASLYKKTTNSKDAVYRLVRAITQNYETTNIESIQDAFLNLNNFFVKEDSLNTHGIIGEIFPNLSRNISNPRFLKEKQDFIYNDIESIINSVKENIFENLVKIKNEEHLMGCYQRYYNDLFGHNSIYSEINSILKDFDHLDESKKGTDDYINKLELLGNKLCSFQFKYLNIEDKDNNPFIKFCIGYYANFKNCLIEVLESEQIRKYLDESTNLKLNIDFESLDFTVEIHSELLKGALTEIIKNSSKNAIRIMASKNIEEITLKFTKVKKNNFENCIIIEQNKPFYNPNNIQRGTKTIIEKVFVTFLNEERYFVLKEPNYTINLFLN